LSADSKPRHPEIDVEVRRIIGKNAQDDSFDYDLMRLFILIQREADDKELAHEMSDEILLVVKDLRERIQKC
jgi:hypothetical protein